MDGVITQTAKVHDAAWKEMFDEFLRDWSASHDQPFVPFDPVDDYDQYVDGKPRLEGTASFLESRGIELPMGAESDPPGTPTFWGLSNKKNDLVPEVIERDGVQAYEGSSRYVDAVREAGLQARRSCRRAPTPRRCSRRRGVADLFEVRVDAKVAEPTASCTASPRPTRSSRRRGCSASPRRTPPSTRTPWPGWPPGERGQLRVRGGRGPGRPGRRAARARRRRGGEGPGGSPVRAEVP